MSTKTVRLTEASQPKVSVKDTPVVKVAITRDSDGKPTYTQDVVKLPAEGFTLVAIVAGGAMHGVSLVADEDIIEEKE